MASNEPPPQTTETSYAHLYGAKYYATQCGTIPYERGQSHWTVFFGDIADVLVRSFQPRRVFDAGCAHGFLVEALWDRGVEAHGRDISPFAISQVRTDLRPFCAVGSLATPIEGRYDLVTCIEVLEHMPEAEALQALNVLTAASDRVLFSSSPVDLTEVTHINVKPPIYWLQRFADRGFAPRMDFDPTFLTPWAMLFEHTQDAIRPADLNAAALLVRQRLQGMEAAQAIGGLQARIAELMAGSATASAELQASCERAQARADAATSRVDAAERAVGAAQVRIMDATVVSQSLRQRAAEADMRAATALHDAKTMLGAAERRHAGERAALQTELQELTHTHHVVVASSTWRAMAPLRAAGRRMPRSLRRRLRQLSKLVWWSATFQLRRRYGEWRVLRARPVVMATTPASRDDFDEPASVPIAAPPLMPALIGGLYEPPPGLLPWFVPLNLEVAPELEHRPVLNVLLPSLARRHLSGGPNTVLNIVCRLMDLGVKLRLVSTDAPPDPDDAGFWDHVGKLIGTVPSSAHAEIADASDRTKPLMIGRNDLFLATAWWTAQMAKYAVRHTRHRRFAYIIQDYEPLLHPSSTQYALAEETYGLDYLPIINTSLLHAFLSSRSVGRFADPAFAAAAIVFEPAVDTTLFYPTGDDVALGGPVTKRQLLFYARPTNAQRNAYELGAAALQKLIAEGHLDPAAWDFVAMGEQFPSVALGGGAELIPAPWLDLQGYADLMRRSDLLLSPMLSPHPSYPPLEMAACGRPVVTTVFGNKTASALASLSPLIIGAEPTIEGLAAGLRQALRLVGPAPARGSNMPTSWDESLHDVVPNLYRFLLEQFGAPSLQPGASLDPETRTARLFPGYRTWPGDRYALFRLRDLAARRGRYHSDRPGLLSLVTTVWNTDPAFVAELAESVFAQQGCGAFEWLILDNGTERDDTRALLRRIADAAPGLVRLERVEHNAGIIGGMRFCLEHAANRYIVPLDSDDLLTPDALAILAASLERAGLPTHAYSDEDKLLGAEFRDPYRKPDWDPVLFFHSCYIAHLCAIDRETALALGAYTGPEAEGAHDWDTFTRFYLAGHTPLHVPEVIYTWRMHPQSTAGNIDSKNYIFASQKSVLGRFVRSLPHPDRFRIEHSPLFGVAPDWRIVGDRDPAITLASLPLDATATIASLRRAVDALDTTIVHLASDTAAIEDSSWPDEGLTLLAAFPDAVMVGGRVHRDGTIVAADTYAAFGGTSPNIGRALTDPGYFAQMWKPHSADAVPAEHCIVRRDFLADALHRVEAGGGTLAGLPLWLGLLARARGRRVIYSPFFCSRIDAPLAAASDWERHAQRYAFARLPASGLLSPRLGCTAATAYLPVIAPERAEPIALDYPAQHRAECLARRITMPDPAATCRVSLLTTLYSGSRPEFFAETIRAVERQTLAPFEWVILEKSAVDPAIATMLDRLETQPAIRRLRAGDLSIIDGMRLCLEHATGDYVIPLDYDDVPTDDALQVLAEAIAAAGSPGLVYSDEDLLADGVVAAPYRRTAFDPVLNAVDSAIWHLCAIRRDRALDLGLYTDTSAEYCHDWDTVTRFADAGDTIHHVPEVLYHWRTHPASSSNSGSVASGSLASVRAMLERTVARQADPSLYEVALWPIQRGFEQYTILRRPIGTPPLETGDLTLVLGPGIAPPAPDAVWEAVRLFEMHRDVGAVSGRVLDPDGIVVEACAPDWVGRHRLDGGDYAQILKPRTVEMLPPGFFICRAALLREAEGRGGEAGVTVAQLCAERGLRLAYSPLIEAWRHQATVSAMPSASV